jgi:hypothetical protein
MTDSSGASELRPARELSPGGADGGRDREAFARARAAWIEQGRADGLERWLARALDPDGVPRRWPVGDWRTVLAELAEVRWTRGEDWPECLDARIEGLFRATLRYTRPDGTPVFGPLGVGADADPHVFRDWARWLPDPGLTTVVQGWFSERERRSGYAPPPLPADARPDRPLAMLRANWTKQGDLLAIDHRAPGASSAVELYGLERPWLGPRWSLDLDGASESGSPSVRARPTCWTSTASADLAEWTFRVGPARVVRTAVLLRGRRLSLLADQVDGPASWTALRVGLAEGVTSEPIPGSRGLALAGGRGRSTMRVFPIGLPRLMYPTDRGTFGAEAGGLLLRQRIEGARGWLPLLVSWEPGRNRLATHWRPLTVSEKSRICPPGVAFAARITWGRSEMLVVYRSLARPAVRAFLGHQTRARFLIGLFSPETGQVEPLLKVEE